jgi:transcriptional regulator with PAS, ATPase and Fis domain
MVKAGSFRADLYYRLDVASIKLPALHDRIDDVEPLTAYFAHRYNQEFGKRIWFISRRALDCCADTNGLETCANLPT